MIMAPPPTPLRVQDAVVPLEADFQPFDPDLGVGRVVEAVAWHYGLDPPTMQAFSVSNFKELRHFRLAASNPEANKLLVTGVTDIFQRMLIKDFLHRLLKEDPFKEISRSSGAPASSAAPSISAPSAAAPSAATAGGSKSTSQVRPGSSGPGKSKSASGATAPAKKPRIDVSSSSSSSTSSSSSDASGSKDKVSGSDDKCLARSLDVHASQVSVYGFVEASGVAGHSGEGVLGLTSLGLVAVVV